MEEKKVFIEGRANGYAPEQCNGTITVGELIEYLSEFDKNAKIYLRNDGGYTYGSIDAYSFSTDEDNENE